MHHKGGARALVAIELDRTSVQLQHHGNQVKSHPAAGNTDGVGAAEVALEQVSTIPFWNAYAAVADAHRDAVAGVLVTGDLDRISRRGILESIGQEVAEQGEQQFSVPPH